MTKSNRMRLWTIQTKETWAHAEESGVLECNELYIDANKAIDSWFRPAYDWMVGQLEQRVKTYPRNKYPIWAWYHPKPDLRRSGHLPRGTSGVRVEFLVSSDRVLLSDFEAWHAVLNCWYLSLSEEESDNWDTRCERAGIKIGWDNWPPPAPFKEEIMRSWERIFDLELLKTHSEWMGGGAIQACIEKIYMDEVVTVTYFKAR
ncbi:DUF3841 domain-containing protein [Methanophagales archaeon]|nr:MAG: DUF3841 domain-containing protein [Methanophagales archaeon]